MYDILYDAVIAAGAKVRYEAEVTSVDSEERCVELASGETLSADVIVGADGEYGPCRAAVIGQQAIGTPTGLSMFEYVASAVVD